MKNKLILIMLLSFFLVGCSTKNEKGIKMSYNDFKTYKIEIPTSFSLMSDEDIKIKYPNNKYPSIVYTNDVGDINIVINTNNIKMDDNTISEYTVSMSKALSNNSENIDNSILKKDNHTIGVIKFTTQATDTKIYNHIFVFSDNGYIRIINFNCPKEKMEDWEKVGNSIMNSIVFK